MNNNLKLSIGIAGLTLINTALGAQEKTTPNILFLFTDDHSMEAITAYSEFFKNSGFSTPHLDQLAAEGALFTNNTVCNSISGPSRAAILTGKHSHANGFKNNHTTFNPNQFTFVRELQKNGYQTSIIGKWHLGEKLNPQDAGFDHYKVLINQGSYYNPLFRSSEKNGKTEMVKGYSTDIITDLSIDWIKNAVTKDKPFLLMCQYKAPHRNWQPAMRHLDLFEETTFPLPQNFRDSSQFEKLPSYIQETSMRIDGHLFPGWDLKLRKNEIPSNYLNLYAKGKNRRPDPGHLYEPKRLTKTDREKYWASYEKQNQAFAQANPIGREQAEWKYQRYIRDYLRTIVALDENIGRILHNLEELGLRHNTLVVYSSDQGFFLGEKGFYDKRFMYNESFMTPLIARLPGVIPAGTKINELTQNIDYGPTFLDIAEVKIPQNAGVHGKSLLPLLKGEKTAKGHDALYYHFTESRAVNPEHSCPAHYGVYDGRYKLIRFYEDYANAWELYDLKNDPHEENNLYESAPAELKTQMLEKLKTLRKKYNDTTGAPL